MTAPAAVFDRLVPGILGNPYVPHFPHPKQAKLLGAHLSHPRDRVFRCLYGGAAGGGKSDALLMAAAQFVEYPHYKALILRRTYTEMALPDAIMSRAIEWWAGKASWNGTSHVMTFPSGAKIQFGYHAKPADNHIYQGGAYHLVGFDELTHWNDESAWEYLSTRIRKAADDPIPLRQLATSNPGGPGHTWVRMMFLGGTDPQSGTSVPPRYPYIPATISDNPSLDRQGYERTLSALHPTLRAQLLSGDWSARDPGDYFRAEWFGPLLDPDQDPVPEGSVSVRWWDLAASTDQSNARTAGVRMVRFPRGCRAVVHAVAFWKTPGDRDAAIIRQARLDGPGTVVGIEIEGGSGGVAQFDQLRDRLRAEGFRVVGARPGSPLPGREADRVIRSSVGDTGKEKRADPVASCLERGHQMRGECPENDSPWWGLEVGKHATDQRDGLRLYAGTWTQGYLDELEGFPELTLKDQVDATSGAWAWLEAHGAGYVPRSDDPQAKPAEYWNVHPDDRPEDPGGFQRWAP